LFDFFELAAVEICLRLFGFFKGLFTFSFFATFVIWFTGLDDALRIILLNPSKLLPCGFDLFFVLLIFLFREEWATKFKTEFVQFLSKIWVIYSFFFLLNFLFFKGSFAVDTSIGVTSLDKLSILFVYSLDHSSAHGAVWPTASAGTFTDKPIGKVHVVVDSSDVEGCLPSEVGGVDIGILFHKNRSTFLLVDFCSPV